MSLKYNGGYMRIKGVKVMIKKISPKVVQINDIIEWHEKGQLELSPKYQRNSVWNEKAKSYLIDTILRGLPIPPIFIRQKIDIVTHSTFREVIDGQQRLRSITEFVEDKFAISKSHNAEYGDKRYSELDDETKENFLSYELFVEIINEKDDHVIYDMFARLNTNNYVLNRQELRNSKYWGEFKVAVYNLAAEFREIFLENNIFNDRQFSRMDDVELISTLLNLSLNGISSDTPNSIDKLYSKFDNSFLEFEDVEDNFVKTMNVIEKIYEYLNGNIICFTTKLYFFTLFAVVYHQLFGLKNSSMPRNPDLSISQYSIEKYISIVVSFEKVFETCISKEDKDSIYYEKLIEFTKYHRTRTTNKIEREIRINILNDFFIEE